jgi:ribosomal protein L24E
VATVVGYFNGDQKPLSLCPVWPLPEADLKNSAVLSQNMLQLVPETDELSRVLRLSVKQDNQLLAEIVEAKGQVVYSQMFSLKSNEFSQKIDPPAGTLVVLTDTSEQTLLSTDELFDLLQQEVDLSESLKIKGQCIPNLNEPQNKQALSLLSENLVEVDINYLFDSTTISGMPVPIEFCRVRVNGKAYNFQSNKTVSLFAQGKQAPYTEQTSAIAQASIKAFKKLKRRLDNTLEK